MNKVVVVDVQDNRVALKSYSDLKYEDVYRVSVLLLTDAVSGDLLMTQRKWTKHNDPGKWMASASGTIEENETYDENIIHEVEEEIGLTDLEFTKGPKEFIDDGRHRFFAQWYLATVDKSKVHIKIQEDEVEAYAWMTKKQLLKELATNSDKFVSSLQKSLDILGVVSA